MNQELKEYIQSSLDEGKSKEDIYKELLGIGWTIEEIQNALGQTGYYQQEQRQQKEVVKKESTQKRTIQIIVVIGAILIGAGIFSFIASNWQAMGKFVKISIIIISMLTSYTVGWYLKEKYNLLKTGGALILLGVIIYGSGIFLIAQMFNVRANWPDGFILWMIGAIALAYAIESFSVYYLAIPLGVVALVGHPFQIFNVGIGYGFILTSPFLLLLAAVITFLIGWEMDKKIPAEIKKLYY